MQEPYLLNSSSDFDDEACLYIFPIYQNPYVNTAAIKTQVVIFRKVVLDSEISQTFTY